MNTLYFESIESCINNQEIFYSMPLIFVEGGGDSIMKEIWKFPR